MNKFWKLFFVVFVACFSSIPNPVYALEIHSGFIVDTHTRYEFEDKGNVSISCNWDRYVGADSVGIFTYRDACVVETINPISILSGESIFVQFWQSDWNDGWAIFETRLADGSSPWTEQGRFNTNKKGTTYALITGLYPGKYDLRFTAADFKGFNNLHIDAGGTTNAPATPEATPEPASLVLLGIGLIGLAGFVKSGYQRKPLV